MIYFHFVLLVAIFISRHSQDWQAFQKEGTLGSCWGLGGLGLLLAGLWALQVVEGSWARVESPSY